jgi:hypothetical protein
LVKSARTSARTSRGTVIDASHRFDSRRTFPTAPLERIVFDSAGGICRTVAMSADELQTLVDLLKGQFDELLEQRRAMADEDGL